ncbi:hypothetical protein [Sinobaca sp. H24]|uniref:hypothetical protein n=1 Tax=Sinobaca sp. H24 TaxID=2923376 RepID=UPI0027E24E65|nr:hypothetical protein [Sinobaca sp. H24]
MSTPDLKARSPWSALNDVDNVTIHPLNGKAVSVDMTVPGSKSFTNRALILAALAEGTSTLSGLLKSDDSYWCLDALEKLGVSSRVTGHGGNRRLRRQLAGQGSGSLYRGSGDDRTVSARRDCCS